MTGVPSHVYTPVGWCIYCGSKQQPLTQEHIIPLFFGGNLLLPDASCKRCERTINSEIETPIAQHEWGSFRIKRNFPSRRKKQRKTDLTIECHDGSQKTIPVWDHSTPVPLYKFGEAGLLAGLPAGLGDDRRWTMVMLTSHDEEVAMQKRFPDWNRVHRFRARPDRFARFIAKIAHGYATAELGPGTFRALTTELILGRSSDFYHFVGGSWDIAPPVPGGDHVTNIGMRFVTSQLARVVVDVRLFSATETPSYHVVVGEVDLTDAAHSQAFDQHVRNGRISALPA